eukprot:TRINITY_DN6211_c0_g2_i2.p3 TRINITY_DN6211_c0_g2~~TRINITY_DN6211_c0_g2_i2.p3  ORF type:complete len:156 (-),score=42.26 TRINITY_DN6211_c0_g2_i2:32-499(-)
MCIRDRLDRINKLQAEIDASRNRRKVELWVPDRVLCKRFGVLPPNESLRKQAEMLEKGKVDKFEDEILPTIATQPPKIQDIPEIRKPQLTAKDFMLATHFGKAPPPPELIDIEEPSEGSSDVKEKVANNSQITTEPGSRPPMNLFKAIFDEDEED